MREIKFRVWKEYSAQFELFTYDDLLNFDSYDKQRLLDSKSSKPMQYTGLKDKNGVEIYEGDIVLLDNDAKEWDVVYCKLTQCPSVRLLAKYGMNIYTFDELHEDDRLDKINVIGNIHQNPELLSD